MLEDNEEIRGRIAIAFPVDFDVRRAAECLQHALNRDRPEQIPTGVDDAYAVEVVSISKATMTVDFVASCLDRQSHRPSRDGVSARLSRHHNELKMSLADCVMWLNSHRTSNLLISRCSPLSASGDVAAAASERPLNSMTEANFALLCASGVLDVVDTSLKVALDAKDAAPLSLLHEEDDAVAQRCRSHQFLRSAFLSHCTAMISPTDVSSSSSLAVSSPGAVQECRDTATRRTITFSDQVAQTHGASASPPQDQREVFSQDLLHDQQCTIASQRQEIAQLRDELECLGLSYRALEGDISSMAAERNRAVARNQEYDAEAEAAKYSLDALRSELAVWKSRAEDADRALMLTVEVDDPQNVASNTSAVPTSLKHISAEDDDTQLLQRILHLREAQVTKLNSQLIASRKETMDVRRQLQQQAMGKRHYLGSLSRSSSSSTSGAYDCSLGPSRCASEEQGGSLDSAEKSDFVALDDLVPRSAVLALQRRCETAEQELRERTLQIAELLKVGRRGAGMATL